MLPVHYKVIVKFLPQTSFHIFVTEIYVIVNQLQTCHKIGWKSISKSFPLFVQQIFSHHKIHCKFSMPLQSYSNFVAKVQWNSSIANISCKIVIFFCNAWVFEPRPPNGLTNSLDTNMSISLKHFL